MFQAFTNFTRTGAAFTAGDLVEGLAFMDVVERRAVLFGIDTSLTADQVCEITHTQALQLQLTPLSAEIVRASPRHIRFDRLFWAIDAGGLVVPMLNLNRTVAECFGGMDLADLTAAYKRMQWIDYQLEADFFMAQLRAELT